MVPIESFHVVVHDQLENVRRQIAMNTSAFSSWSEGLRIGIARNPDTLFIGEVGEQQILICKNKNRSNPGRPFLRAALVDDNNSTIITGRLGVHNAVVLVGGLMLIMPALEKPAQNLPPVLGILLAFIGGGYLYERRQLLLALATCLGVDTRDFK